jgi:plastocyanin
MLHPERSKFLLLIMVLITALAGCGGGSKVQTAAPMSNGGSIVILEASSFKFSPNEIRVPKPGLLAIEIRNVSGSEHNLTVKDARGKVVKDVNIRPHGTVITNIDFSESGTYDFFCNKMFHTTLGMKGRIIVGR